MTSYVWRGSGANHTGSWETATDWSPVGVPGAADTAIIATGTVTEDVNQTPVLPNNTINPGVDLSSLYVSAGAALDVGDAGGTNLAILTLDDSVASTLLGSIVIYSGGDSGSELRASGTIQTSKSGVTQTGAIDIDDGKLLAVGSLTIAGSGVIAMDGGYIGGSSASPSANFYNHATILGVGYISAANDYAASPAAPLSGALNYNGLVTYNYGTIDATNLAAGANYFSVLGGVVYNYGTMEATNSVSGSSGYAALGSDLDAKIVNEADGVIAADAGAFVTLGGAVTNKGNLVVDGGFMTFTGALVSTGQGTVDDGGDLAIDASATIAGALTIDDDSGLDATGTLATTSGTLIGAIDIDGGRLTAAGTLKLTGAGTVNLDGGTIIDSSTNSSDTLISNVTIAGTGEVSAYNSYMNTNNYKGLITDNDGAIDATNVDAGGDYLTISGGSTYNFGTLEATNSVSGSSGYAVLASDDDATIVNESGAQILASAGAYVVMGGPVNNKGDIIADGGSATFDDTLFSTGDIIVEAGGAFNFDGVATIAGDLNVSGDDSQVVGTGTLATSSGSTDGTIEIGSGSLFAQGTLNITGGGSISVDGGQIGSSSSEPTDTLVNRVAISGVGDFDAYNDYSGVGAYDGLDINNYGTIDATNVDSGANFLSFYGGVVRNFATLEANNSVSGSSGEAYLALFFGAEIINASGAVMAAGAGAAIDLDGGTIDNGEILGELVVFGSGNVIEGTGSNSSTLTNKGAINIYGALTMFAGAANISNESGRIEVDGGGSLALGGTINNTLGTIAIDGGTFRATPNSTINNSLGQFIVGENGSGGSATINGEIGGDGHVTVDSGYLTLNHGENIAIDDNGVLAIGAGGGEIGFVTLGASGAIDLDSQLFNNSLTGTFYQASGTSGTLTLAFHTFQIMGDYQAVGTTTNFGSGGGTSGFAIGADASNHNVAQIYR